MFSSTPLPLYVQKGEDSIECQIHTHYRVTAIGTKNRFRSIFMEIIVQFQLNGDAIRELEKLKPVM